MRKVLSRSAECVEISVTVPLQKFDDEVAYHGGEQAALDAMMCGWLYRSTLWQDDDEPMPTPAGAPQAS